jgi:hypothetical protein
MLEWVGGDDRGRGCLDVRQGVLRGVYSVQHRVYRMSTVVVRG